MAELKAELKRSFLQSLYDCVQDSTASEALTSGDTPPEIASLEDALKAFQRMGFQGLKNGKISLGSSGFQQQVVWAAPSIGTPFSQDEVFSMAQEFREVYADAVTALAAAGTASATDAQILAQMMDDDRLQTVNSISKDFTTMRLGAQRY